MIKKIVLFSALILFCVSAFAQDKMDKATFEHLVDYANCQYLMAFIEKNDAGKPYINDTYGKKVKPVLLEATIDNLNAMPNYNKIKSLFPNNSNNSALQLAEKINDRKRLYESYTNNKSLIESLRTTDWKSVDLNVVAIRIQNKAITKFKTEPIQNQLMVSEQEVKNQTNLTSSKVDELKAITDSLQVKTESLQQQLDYLNNDLKLINMPDELSSLRLLVFICLGTIVILIAALIFWYKSQFNAGNRNSTIRKFVKNVLNNSEEIKEKFEKYQIKTNGSGGKDIDNQTENRISILEKQFAVLQRKAEEIPLTMNQDTTTQATIQTTTETSNSSLPKERALYFASKSNKQLTEQQPNSANASFKVFAFRGNEAEFEYIGVVRNENWFEGICSIENSANDNLSDKNQIHTVRTGRVRKENNNWVVNTPAKIKFV